MKWRNDIEVILENTKPKLELSGSVKEEIYNQLEYHFFFFTDISLNQSKGKIYFSKKIGTKQTEIVLDEGIISLNINVGVIITSYPIKLQIQLKEKRIDFLDQKIDNPAIVFANFEGINPQKIYNTYKKISYIEYLETDNLNYKLEVDHFVLEAVFLEIKVKNQLYCLSVINMIVKILNDYDSDGNIHNFGLKKVDEDYIQLYIDFGSTYTKGVNYTLKKMNDIKFIESVRLSSYPENI